MPKLQKVKLKEIDHFLISSNFPMVFREQIATSQHPTKFLSQGAAKIVLNVRGPNQNKKKIARHVIIFLAHAISSPNPPAKAYKPYNM